MSNVIDYVLDVLATSPEEINRIAVRLKQPSTKLLDWAGKQHNCKPDEIVQFVTELVSFEPTKNLFYVHESVNKSRRFSNHFKSRHTGIVDSHMFLVSQEFPNAVFLLEHFDIQYSYSGKRVIQAGEVVQEIFDGTHKSQGIDWVLLDIFSPFRAEWCEGLNVGSLWSQWVKDVATVVEQMRKEV